MLTDPLYVEVLVPALTLISNYKAYKKSGSASHTITTQALREELDEHTAVPSNVDEAFVLGYNIDESDIRRPLINIVVSTLRLATMDAGECLNGDGSHKVNYNKKPVTLFGFSDKERHFKTVLICVSSCERCEDHVFMLQCWIRFNPTLQFRYVMADAAEAMANAARTFWSNIIRLMCYAHLYKVIKNKFGMCLHLFTMVSNITS